MESKDIKTPKKGEKGAIKPDKPHMFQHLLKSTPDNIYIKDKKGRFLEVSDSVVERFGCTDPTQVIGKTDADFFGPDLTRQAKKDEQEILRTGRPIIAKEEKQTWLDGRETWVSTTKIPFPDRDGNIIGILGTSRDITKRKKAQQKLQHQLSFQQLVAEISSAFVNTPAENVNNAIDHALKRSALFFKADRSYVFQFHPDLSTVTNTHEWCKDKTHSQIKTLQSVTKDSFPWLLGKNLRAEHVAVSDTEQLPKAAGAEKDFFKKQGVKSFLSIPLISEGQVLGFFGYDSLTKRHAWSTPQISLLKIVGEIIANGLVKNRTQETMQESERKYRELFENAPIGIALTSSDGWVIDSNSAFAKMLGYNSFEEIKKNLQNLDTDLYVDPGKRTQLIEQLREKGKVEEFEYQARGADGKKRWISLNARIEKWLDENSFLIHGFCSDITKRKILEKKLEEQATHDELTGLWNRRYFFQHCNAEIQRALRYGSDLSMMMIDIDNFKKINDTFGHAAGDQALREFTSVLKSNLRLTDIPGRLGGEEFGVLLPNTNPKDAVVLAERLKNIIAEKKFRLKGNGSTSFTISIGVAPFQEQIKRVDQILKKADKALYEAKAMGRNCVVLYKL